MEQSYEIMPCGTKAKTLNPLDKLLPAPIDAMICGDVCACLAGCLKNAWYRAEDSRVTYEIEPQYEMVIMEMFGGKFPIQVKKQYTPGTIVLGQIINGKLRIK